MMNEMLNTMPKIAQMSAAIENPSKDPILSLDTMHRAIARAPSTMPGTGAK